MYRQYWLLYTFLGVFTWMCSFSGTARADKEVTRPSLNDLINITYPADLNVTKVFARSQARHGSSPNYKSYAVEEFTIEGEYTPTHDDEGLVIFSDDGVDVYVDGELVHNLLFKGQHMPALDQSFHPLNVKLSKGKTVAIRIIYSNILFFVTAGDVDGATLFVYKYEDSGPYAIDDDVDTNTGAPENVTSEVETPSEEPVAIIVDRYAVGGGLNINPGNSRNVRFKMQTPSGKIDTATLESNGSRYVYTGEATEIKIRPRALGRTLKIAGPSTNEQYFAFSKPTMMGPTVRVEARPGRIDCTVEIDYAAQKEKFGSVRSSLVRSMPGDPNMDEAKKNAEKALQISGRWVLPWGVALRKDTDRSASINANFNFLGEKDPHRRIKVIVVLKDEKGNKLKVFSREYEDARLGPKKYKHGSRYVYTIQRNSAEFEISPDLVDRIRIIELSFIDADARTPVRQDQKGQEIEY